MLTKTDLDMLEAAAKAVGWRVVSRREFEGLNVDVGGGATIVKWNPLGNDGDALRLAVALRIDLQLFAAQSQNPWVRGCVDREGKSFGQQVVNGDALAATRRAIVRAAAALAAA